MRFFLGQVVSSLGDWIGLIAIVSVAKRIYDDEFAVAAVLLARLAPAFFFGPIAGVAADRWSRKKVMVFCDIGRAGLIATLPFAATIGSAVPLLNPVVLLLLVSAGLEILTLMWQPAKDASVPVMVKRHQLTHAYSLLLLGAYLTFPLSGAAFGLLAHISRVFGLSIDQENLALFVDSATFLISALLTLSLVIPARPEVKHAFSVKAVWGELTHGLAAMWNHAMIRPWVLGIFGTFAGIGIFISMAPFFVADVLGGGPASFGFLITAVGIGLGSGFILTGGVSRVVPKDVLFSVVVVALGLSMVAFGSVSTITTALVWAAIAGLFGGFAYPSGYALVQEQVEEAVRGRILAAVNSLIRLAVVGAAALAPVVVRLVDALLEERPLRLLEQVIDVRGVRVVMWAGGVFILLAGSLTTQAIRARFSEKALRTGLFVVFEGGEGSGKTSQIARLHTYLKSQGVRVVVTREPGGTGIGGGVRELLLDTRNTSMSPKAEALLYAADRAQHVDQVVRPALDSGAVVISDRYIDSSVAYQGVARGLGADEIRDLNRWGTDGLLADIVFLLDFEASQGLFRSGSSDRIEREDLSFHQQVREAFHAMASRFSDRFVLIDASRSEDEVEAEVRSRVLPLVERMVRDNPFLLPENRFDG